MTTNELRNAYLDFFQKRNHRVFSSDSLIPVGDTVLLFTDEDTNQFFTGAGMLQFKPHFLGLKKELKRAVSCQKCLRTADLDRVGKTPYHHSFFEMLGNFSFGDYFKEEAIGWGWEFVTQVLKLPREKLWVSVYEEDEEAFSIWKNKIGLPETRIVRMGAVDNFWPSNAKIDGPNGPCGPCSEIYAGSVPGTGVEIWNLVFTQFDRQSDGSLKSLPQKNIDTGMGLERTASVLQGVESNFDIDIFREFRGQLRTLLKKNTAHQVAHENAVMDHARAAVFCIADGALPSNEGLGYVVRKLIRLGCDHLTKAGAEPGQFKKLVAMVTQIMGTAYPEIANRQKEIVSVMENEESAYQEVLNKQVPKLRQQIKETASADREKVAFTFYDTYGVPLSVIESVFQETGSLLNREVFNHYLDEQKNRSRASSKITREIFSDTRVVSWIKGLMPSKFLGYDKTETDAKLQRFVKMDDRAGVAHLLIFERTPFYAEAGGQIGDTGEILGKKFKAKVLDTQFIEKCIAHKVQISEGRPEEGEIYTLKVDAERRADIMKNHTATHLLHSALRKVLGDHVKQSGSLVAPDRLRFDFTHFRAVGPESLNKIEALVNEQVKKNICLEKEVLPRTEAVQRGAIAFFGEKYGEDVRVVSIGNFSKELCGGTHLVSTGPIGLFKIISEGSVQAGVRRIEAVTGRSAEQLICEQNRELEEICATFHARKDSLKEDLKKEAQGVTALKNRLGQSVASKIKSRLSDAITRSGTAGGVKLVSETLDGADVDLMRSGFEHLKSAGASFALFLTSGDSEKISFLVAGSSDLVQKGFDAGKIVKLIATLVEGNGGGRSDFAVGGGKRVDKKNEALAFGEKEIRRELAHISGKAAGL